MAAPMVTPPTGASLQRLAEQSWDRIASGSVLCYEDERWTGEQLAERIRRVAGGLVEAGLLPGERVVVCMANCPEVSITYAAIWRAGAVATPVLFLLSEDELRHVLSDSGAALVVTTAEFLPKVTAAAAHLPNVRAIVVVGEPIPGPSKTAGVPLLPYAELEVAPPARLTDSDPAALAALLYTGGTTGRSKGVMISQRGLHEREISDDQGFTANAELDTPNLCAAAGAQSMQCTLLGFFDDGNVYRNQALPGEETHVSVDSAGAGFRLARGRMLSLQMDYGHVISASDTQQKGEQRFDAVLAVSF